MACILEIKKTINESIDKQLPYREVVMSDKAAKSISQSLNLLWNSAITRIAQYSSQGGYRVIVNSIEDAAQKELKKQQEAEKLFERDLAFFNGDEALLEQENPKETFYQKNQTISSEGKIASEKTIRDLAARMSDRIGMPFKIESDRTKEYKGKIENGVAYVNLAYATLDTPIHEILGHPIIRAIRDSVDERGDNVLYQNLLKELEYGVGGEVLDRIKKDYVNKPITESSYTGDGSDFESWKKSNVGKDSRFKYSLKEQQEEALVELLGMMTADKLDNVKDGKLISLLKRLLKEIKQVIKSLIKQREVEIENLPDNLTINDLSNLLAYSNSKLILPGYEVEYTTPDNMKFKTYQEASNHISELAKSTEEIDLSNFTPVNKWRVTGISWGYNQDGSVEQNGYINEEFDTKEKAEDFYSRMNNTKYAGELTINKANSLPQSFIDKNKEYEQSKEIVEEWKKVNNIQYNPEEIYSRGQEFSSVVGAYSDFDVNLMMQNLLQHIEDNEKAGGKFAISAYTKPVDKTIGHLEGGGGKIKFKIYPKSEDILWAANTDVYSGSVWDASEKVNKDKQSELLGVSYTKYPSIRNINAVQSNLASIVDDLAHHHNELGIVLTGNNFRLEYDEDIPYQTKKIIDGINSILDQKYGKLVKPEIKKTDVWNVFRDKEYKQSFNTEKDAEEFIKKQNVPYLHSIKKEVLGVKPTQTNENTTHINTIKQNAGLVSLSFNEQEKAVLEKVGNVFYQDGIKVEIIEGDNNNPKKVYLNGVDTPLYKEDYVNLLTEKYKELFPFPKKEFTNQALINTKIAKLKEVAKAQPRSLIRSEVIEQRKDYTRGQQTWDPDFEELPFQKIPSKLNESKTISSIASKETIAKVKDFLKRIGVDISSAKEIIVNGKRIDANAIANITQALIQVVEGKEAQSLPEEAMHFAVEILEQTNPKLFNQLLKEIGNYALYSEVLSEYAKDPNYQTKEGKPDIRKIKKEAIGKVLAETIIKQAEDINEKPELLTKVNSWWSQILDYLKGLFSQSGFDKVAMDILSGKNIGTAADIIAEEGSVYLQKSKQDDIYDSIKELGETITPTNEGYSIDGKPIKRRVSDIVKDWYDRKFTNKSLVASDYEKAVNDLKAEKGTAGHAAFEYAFDLFVDADGYLREDELPGTDYEIKNPNFPLDFYLILKENLRQRLNSFPKDNGGTRFMAEARIYDAKRDLAGTVDFLAITPEGKVSILDWKFMDLNIEKYTDIPWYKVNAWNTQMEQYKLIIGTVYGVKPENFEQTMMIPIKAIYTQGNPKEGIMPRLDGINIGDVNIKNIEEDYLIPVGLKEQSTGIKKVDDLLEKLNAIYKKLSDQKVTEETKTAKAEQLNALFSAIRQLQMKQNVIPLINQAKILNKQIENLFAQHETEFKDKEINDFKDNEIEDFTKKIETLREAIEVYLNLDLELKFLFEGEQTTEDKELKQDLRDVVDNARDYYDRLKTLDEEFTVKFIGGTSTAEKVVKGLARMFGTTATIQLESLSALYKKANKAFGLAGMDTSTEIKRLSDLKDAYQTWALSNGLTIKNQFNILKKEDTNELIDEFNPEFYSQLKEKIALKDFSWIRANIDIPGYREFLKKKKEEEYDRIDSKLRVGTEEQIANEIKRETFKAEQLYNTNEPESVGWLLYDDISKYPKRATWESDQWKTLNKDENKPALDFYNYIRERNDYYRSIGYIHAKQARIFLPWVRKGLAEKMIFGGKITIGEQFLRNISVDEGDTGYGQIDPLNGQPIDTIPIYLTRKLEGEVSTDLFKTMAMYNEFAIKFKYLSEIEGQGRALIRLEKNKKAIATSMFSKTEYKNNVLQFNPDNSQNTKLVASMVKAIIYQQKYVQNETFDQLLGNLGSYGEKINAKLGRKIFPEDLKDRQVSINKVITQMNNTFQLNALGLNVLSSLSNLFGGKTQSFINSGKWFTKQDFIATEQWLAAGKMGGNDRQKSLAAMDYFMPFIADYNKQAMQKLSLSKLNDQAVQEYLMVMMRKSEEFVQTTNFFSFLRNSIIQDGNIINTREYLKSTDEYKDFYAGSQEERTTRAAKFEADVKDLNAKQGVMALSTVVNGEFVIPGIERKSDSVLELRRKVQSFTADALGSMGEDNKRLMNMTVYGNSMMLFKNWIPRLVDVRMGNLKYNSASDAYEWGRTRMIARIFSEDLLGAIGNLKNSLLGNDKGIDFLRQLYEKKKNDYEADTNKELKMTESEFIDLTKQNIKNQLFDLLALATMWSLYLGLKALAPDDDEDPAVKNQYKFLLKATDKFKDELQYFYDPTSISQLVGKGIFPSLALLENYAKIIKNFMIENYAIVSGNEKLEQKNYVIKYLMKTFPLSSQAASLMPLFYPALAKDLGIKAQSHYNIR
jgi:hypothetical protein